MLLDKLDKYYDSDRIFYRHKDKEYSYKDLIDDSNALAAYLDEALGDDKTPVVVYGHKEYFMPMAFLACSKSGRAYCPVDTSVPFHRLKWIVDRVDPGLVISMEDIDLGPRKIIAKEEIKEIISQPGQVCKDKYLRPEDVYYIIFTSGSTGDPKGVEITYSNLNSYIEWGLGLAGQGRDKVFLNQAPFSFDLSIMDLYLALGGGSCLYTLDKETQSDFELLMKALEESRCNYWVSTPSFADLCMADKSFDGSKLKNIEKFLFCGEVLTKKTAQMLLERFPRAKVINTYGPSESTCCMTAIEVDEDLLKSHDILPIGSPKPGMEILFENGDSGEMTLVGDTVGRGYFKDQGLTERAFGEMERQGKKVRYFKTGDLGKLEAGHYYCLGRKDSQVKLNGYRIELGDIESNLNDLADIDKAVVVAHKKDNKVDRLTAFIVLQDGQEGNLAKTLGLKKALKDLIPDYMVPSRFVYLESFPMNQNAKIDRKSLEAKA